MINVLNSYFEELKSHTLQDLKTKNKILRLVLYTHNI